MLEEVVAVRLAERGRTARTRIYDGQTTAPSRTTNGAGRGSS